MEIIWAISYLAYISDYMKLLTSIESLRRKDIFHKMVYAIATRVHYTIPCEYKSCYSLFLNFSLFQFFSEILHVDHFMYKHTILWEIYFLRSDSIVVAIATVEHTTVNTVTGKRQRQSHFSTYVPNDDELHLNSHCQMFTNETVEIINHKTQRINQNI